MSPSFVRRKYFVVLSLYVEWKNLRDDKRLLLGCYLVKCKIHLLHHKLYFENERLAKRRFVIFLS